MSNYSNEMVVLFRALANINRLHIYQTIASCCKTEGNCSPDNRDRINIGELAGCCDIAASTLSHHVRELVLSGLVVTEREGKQIFCKVNPEALKRVRQFFEESL
jgi:DNA-binding transcriptional ArsR family regulator